MNGQRTRNAELATRKGMRWGTSNAEGACYTAGWHAHTGSFVFTLALTPALSPRERGKLWNSFGKSNAGDLIQRWIFGGLNL